MDLRALAKRQLADYDRHEPGTCFAGEEYPATVEEAYRLQMEVARLRHKRGEPLAGYKVGCISPAIQAQLGLDRPVFGHVYGTELFASGSAFDLSRFAKLAIEGEYAVRLAVDVPDPEWLRRHWREAIASVFPVIELHNSVFRRGAPSSVELIANNGIHAGVVMPNREVPMGDPGAGIEVRKNGNALGTASGREVPDFPLGSLILLAEHLAQFGSRLRRGQVVLTGSPLPLYPVAEGDCIEVNGTDSEVMAMCRF